MSQLKRFAPLTFVLAIAAACERAPQMTPELQAIIANENAPLHDVSTAVWTDTRAFYEARGQTLAWVGTRGPDTRTLLALDAVHAAEAHGLDAADYGETRLREAHAALQQDSGDEKARANQLAVFDVELTTALLTLGRDVATGRLTPDVVDVRWKTTREAPAYVTALQHAAQGDPRQFLDAVQPRHPEYRALVGALAALRGQEATGWPQVPRVSLKLGQWNRAVVLLRQRLRAAGHLRETAVMNSPEFDDDVEAGVKAFQEHVALPPTGKLDRATLDKLNVPLAARIAQVAINLERWRWLPDDLGARHFLVNVPYFHLIAREEGKPVLDIRVVVGKRGNETPLFSDEMETVVFSPYWNIPETIALEETTPAVARDPEYLSRNNMEIVDRRGRVVSLDSVPWGDEMALRGFRFRQRPGSDNALGFVKFLFPNEHSVYLHDTPADALFRRIGRAFSHGCIRVEEPEVLARYVLRDQPEWTADAIHAAMRAGEERHVKLTAPLPIHIIYMTAWVDEGGGLHYQNDIYGYDARQLQAGDDDRDR
jgi:murein L,D-transpeptidase YcbB/YkuD